MAEQNPTSHRLRTWGSIALRPESWPLEFLLLLGVTGIYKVLVDRTPPVDTLWWIFGVISTIMTNPVALAMLVPFSSIIFYRGIRQVIAAEELRSSKEAKNQAIRAQELLVHDEELLKRIRQEFVGVTRLSGLFARCYLIQENLSDMQRNFDRAVDSYEKFSVYLEHLNTSDGHPHIRKELEILRGVINESFAAAHTYVLGQNWKEVTMLEAKMSWDEQLARMVFNRDDNGTFLSGLADRQRKLKDALDSYRFKLLQTAQALQAARVGAGEEATKVSV